jgi:hypothetical protein
MVPGTASVSNATTSPAGAEEVATSVKRKKAAVVATSVARGGYTVRMVQSHNDEALCVGPKYPDNCRQAAHAGGQPLIYKAPGRPLTTRSARERYRCRSAIPRRTRCQTGRRRKSAVELDLRAGRQEQGIGPRCRTVHCEARSGQCHKHGGDICVGRIVVRPCKARAQRQRCSVLNRHDPLEPGAEFAADVVAERAS